MKIKELAIAFVLIFAYVFISSITLMQVISFFSVLSMVQPTSQIPLYVTVIVIGLLFGVIFKVLSKKFLYRFEFTHFLILSIIFIITGSLVTHLAISSMISFIESIQHTYLYLFIIYSIVFIIGFNIFKRK